MKINKENAIKLGEKIGIDWKTSKFPVEDFVFGLKIELEHGKRSPKTNVTNNDPITTAKIALAHLNEFPLYYKALKKMEEELKKTK